MQASHCNGFSCCGAQTQDWQARVVAARGLGSSHLQAQLLYMWNLPRPGIKPTSPASAVDPYPLCHQGPFSPSRIIALTISILKSQHVNCAGASGPGAAREAPGGFPEGPSSLVSTGRRTALSPACRRAGRALGVASTQHMSRPGRLEPLSTVRGAPHGVLTSASWSQGRGVLFAAGQQRAPLPPPGDPHVLLLSG